MPWPRYDSRFDRRWYYSAAAELFQESPPGDGPTGRQFNFVVSTNDRAVRLWRSFDFDIVGTLPGAFAHPTLRYVDALVMFKRL
jgi:hypothetical protein